MPGKHAARQFGLPRYSFIVAAAVVLVILVAWVAVRAAGPGRQEPPIMVVPSTKPAALGLPVPAPSAPSTSRAASPATVSSTRVGAPTAERAVERATSAAPAPVAFSADYRTGAERRRGFTGAIQVTNPGGKARTWRVTLTFDPGTEVQLTEVRNADSSRTGDTWTLTGRTLAPGATTVIGFQATKRTRTGVRPTACVVNATPCRVS